MPLREETGRRLATHLPAPLPAPCSLATSRSVPRSFASLGFPSATHPTPLLPLTPGSARLLRREVSGERSGVGEGMGWEVTRDEERGWERPKGTVGTGNIRYRKYPPFHPRPNRSLTAATRVVRTEWKGDGKDNIIPTLVLYGRLLPVLGIFAHVPFHRH